MLLAFQIYRIHFAADTDNDDNNTNINSYLLGSYHVTWHRAKHFRNISSFNPCKIPMKQILLLVPLQKGGDRARQVELLAQRGNDIARFELKQLTMDPLP